jgi:BirA family biotin operon repressor/biotin-[acetyl-CoA-carboxylase] ligase
MEEQLRFIELFEAESTNDYAMELIRQGLATPEMAVFTARQTRGKGQRGKSWQSEPGKNTALSILLQPDGNFPLDRFYFNAFLTLSCLRFLETFLEKELSIKWPNDLYFENKKLGGILIENIIRGGVWQWSVVGIGVNVNQKVFPELENRAISLSMIVGSEIDVRLFAEDLHRQVVRSLRNPSEPTLMMKEFNEELFMRGKQTLLQHGTSTGMHKIIGVDERGRLMTTDQDGCSNAFDLGEVVWK